VVTTRKAVSVGGLLTAAAVLCVCGVSIVIANPLLDVGACGTNSKTVPWPVWVAFVTAGVVAFGLGSLLGHWRDLVNEIEEEAYPGSLTADAGLRADERRRRRAETVRLFLAVALTLLTGLLAYETWAVWNGSPWWAITDFVRCASNAAMWQTLVASTALLFLAGHWLWHPKRGART
jgi:polyferredoxin